MIVLAIDLKIDLLGFSLQWMNSSTMTFWVNNLSLGDGRLFSFIAAMNVWGHRSVLREKVFFSTCSLHWPVPEHGNILVKQNYFIKNNKWADQDCVWSMYLHKNHQGFAPVGQWWVLMIHVSMHTMIKKFTWHNLPVSMVIELIHWSLCEGHPEEISWHCKSRSYTSCPRIFSPRNQVKANRSGFLVWLKANKSITNLSALGSFMCITQHTGPTA